MKQFNGYLFSICFFLFVTVLHDSCIVDYASTTSSVIKNTTIHNIKIEPYLNGIIDNTAIVTILGNTDKEVIKNSSIRGKATGASFGRLLQPYDSLIISFDGIKKSNHLKFSSTIADSLGYILFDKNRSFTNDANWNKTTLDETKHNLNTLFEYTFVEQDYLNAK